VPVSKLKAYPEVVAKLDVVALIALVTTVPVSKLKAYPEVVAKLDVVALIALVTTVPVSKLKAYPEVVAYSAYATNKELVLANVRTRLLLLYITPPTYKSPPMPTPPATVNAPESVDVELVLLVTEILLLVVFPLSVTDWRLLVFQIVMLPTVP
jgi:hypothetical protein